MTLTTPTCRAGLPRGEASKTRHRRRPPTRPRAGEVALVDVPLRPSARSPMERRLHRRHGGRRARPRRPRRSDRASTLRAMPPGRVPRMQPEAPPGRPRDETAATGSDQPVACQGPSADPQLTAVRRRSRRRTGLTCVGPLRLSDRFGPPRRRTSRSREAATSGTSPAAAVGDPRTLAVPPARSVESPTGGGPETDAYGQPDISVRRSLVRPGRPMRPDGSDPAYDPPGPADWPAVAAHSFDRAFVGRSGWCRASNRGANSVQMLAGSPRGARRTRAAWAPMNPER
jgi:hypothetical protein